MYKLKGLNPKVHTIRFMRSCVSSDSGILCGFYCNLHTMRYMQQVFVLISCCGKIINNFRSNRKSNCDFKRIYGINDMFMNLRNTYLKELKTSVPVNLSPIFLVYKLTNSKEMTLST